MAGYKETYPHMSEEDIIREAKKLFAIADSDGSGAIDYSEWQIATINKFDILKDDKLRGAFDLFDRVNSFITN